MEEARTFAGREAQGVCAPWHSRRPAFGPPRSEWEQEGSAHLMRPGPRRGEGQRGSAARGSDRAGAQWTGLRVPNWRHRQQRRVPTASVSLGVGALQSSLAMRLPCPRTACTCGKSHQNANAPKTTHPLCTIGQGSKGNRRQNSAVSNLVLECTSERWNSAP